MTPPTPLKPSVTLLVKLGSIAVHAHEYLGPHGHPFDRDILEDLLADSEVKAWLAAMEAMAMLPLERNP